VAVFILKKEPYANSIILHGCTRTVKIRIKPIVIADVAITIFLAFPNVSQLYYNAAQTQFSFCINIDVTIFSDRFPLT
jgi:hypothetical protein